MLSLASSGPDPPPSELAAESSSCRCSPPRGNLEVGQRKVSREPHWEDAGGSQGQQAHLGTGWEWQASPPASPAAWAQLWH